MFETALLDTRKKPKGRLFFVPVAVGVHVMVALGVVFMHYWTVEAVAEPPIMVSFQQPPPLPAPPPAAPPPAPPKPKAPTPVQAPPDVPVQPPEVPDEIPDLPADLGPPSTGTGEGVEGGVPGGVEGGVQGGTGTAPVGVEGGLGDEILRVGGDVQPPEKIFSPPPEYTEVARRARISGVVIVEAIIDEQGNVTNVRVLKGLPMGLEDAAVNAVKRWKFKPARLNNQAVSVYYSLTVKFQLT